MRQTSTTATVGDIASMPRVQALIAQLFQRLGVDGPPYPTAENLPENALDEMQAFKNQLVKVGRIAAKEYKISWEDTSALHQFLTQHDKPLLPGAKAAYRKLKQFVRGEVR